MSDITLSSISIYPVKSLKGLTLSGAFVGDHGLEFDRRFMLSDEDGNLLSARELPELLLFQVLLREDGLEIVAPDGDHLTVRVPELFQNYRQVVVWGDEINAQRCGPTADEWFSEKLNLDCELLYFGEQSERFTSRRPDKAVAFSDGYPLLLISEESLNDLNQRSQSTIGIDQFRTNLVINGCDTFAEDGWKRIRIGEVEFEIVKPCSRCVMTTYDSQTAQTLPYGEPLQTLAKYRRGEDGEVYFGQNLVALNSGYIRNGDSVEILERQTAEIYPDNAEKINPAIETNNHIWDSGKRIKLTCENRIQETPDVVTFRFSLPDALTASYKAGQFITLFPEIENQEISRCYTLSSSPSRPSDLSITVKRVTQGIVSNWLHDQLHVGDQISALPPQGIFHAEASRANKLLLLSAGSGITPMLSICRQLSDTHSSRDIIFYHQARTASDLIAEQELLWLEQQNPNLKVIFSLSQSDPLWQGVQGRISQQQLVEQIPDLSQRTVFCCGPQGFMQQAKTFCLQAGISEENWLEESFSQPPGVKPTVTKASFNLSFNGEVVEGNNQNTLLKQAESNGISISFGCRAGICGACQIKLVSGEVLRESELPLSEEDKANGIILACSCIPQSDLEIEI